MVCFCYVYYCPYHRRNIQKQKGKVKPSFFRASNLEVFNQWKAVVPKEKKFIQSDRICELHFKSADVIRFYEQTLKDGSVFRLKRGHPCLVKNAVPCIFDMPLILERRKELARLSEECSQEVNAAIPSVPQEGNSNEAASQMITLSRVQQLMSKNPPKSPFEVIVDKLSTIKPPGPDWGISFIKERYPNVSYILCAKWKSFVPERKLIIDNLLNVKTFLKGQEFPWNIPQITCIEDITSLLIKVDRLTICADFPDSNASNCQIVIKDNNFRRSFCDKCGIRRKKESDSVRVRLKSKRMGILLSKSLELSEKLWAQEE